VKSGGPFIVAIDGPAGAGKSTASKVLARRLGFTLVDTGAIYRGAALVALEHGIEKTENHRLRELLERMRLEFQPLGDENRVFLDGRDVSDRIRTPEVSMAASRISADPSVRQALLPLQRRLALQAERGSVLEGRDIGTVVFPDADVKFFLDAAPEIRARRRREELLKKGIARSPEEVLAEQAKGTAMIRRGSWPRSAPRQTRWWWIPRSYRFPKSLRGWRKSSAIGGRRRVVPDAAGWGNCPRTPQLLLGG